MAIIETDVPIEVEGEEIDLLPEKALYWPRHAALIVSDVHIGKAAAFRSEGVPIPRGTTTTDLRKLSTAIVRTGATSLYVLGDMYHAERGRDSNTLDLVARWRESHPELVVHVVMGNHDRRTTIAAGEFGFEVYRDPLSIGPFVLCHEPRTVAEGYALCGHVHPAVIMRSGREMVRVPCFLFRPEYGVLPAFGEFTGCGVVSPDAMDRVFVVADNEVIEVG